MGVPKLKNIFIKKLPSIITTTRIRRNEKYKKPYNHLFVDLNFLIYFFSRRFLVPSMSKKLLLEPIYKEFDSMLNYFQVKKSFSIFLDGSPPILKIPLMYKNRRKNKNINQLQITPETPFLKEIKNMIIEDYSKICEKKGIEFFVSGSCESGEGEMKILKRMNEKNINSDALIVGCDSDFIPICISTNKKIDFFFRNFSTDSEVFDFEIFDNELKLMFNTNDVSNIRLDLTFLCLLQGNDYLPKPNRFNLTKVLENYTNFVSESNENFLVKILENGKYYLNIPFLLKVMNLSGNALNLHYQMLYDRETIINYLRLLLWNLDMYLNGECMDYQFMPDVLINILPEILYNEYKNNPNFMDEIQPPKKKSNPLNPLTISRAVR